MALIAVAADKGAPGVTTTATALATVWPRPVVLAECDPAGGDIVYRLPGAHGGRLDPRRGLLSLAVAARHGLEPGQVWEHAQRLRGGLDVLAGVTNAEQGSGIEPLWGPVGGLLATLPGADVIADCGRLGPDGPHYELLAAAAIVVLIIRPSLGEVLRLRDRVAAVALAAGRRGGREPRIGVLVVAERRGYRRALAEVSHAVGGANSPVGLVAGIAFEPKSAQRLRGEWGGRLDKSLLIRTARDAAAQLAGEGQPTARPSSTRPVRAAAPAAGRVPDGRPPGAVRLADAAWRSGPRPADTARSAGPAASAAALPAAHTTGPVRVNGHGLHTAGTQETRAWALGAREPAARADGRPAAAASAGRHTGDWPATQAASAAGPPAGEWTAGRAASPTVPRGWDRQQHAHHEEAGRPGPPWPDPAWPGSAPGQPVAGQQLNGYPSAAELTAARVSAAQLAADQLSAAELTAAQAAAARLSAAQAAGARLNPAQAAGARRARRGLSRNTGRGAGRGRHAGRPAPPADPDAADPDATGPGAGRARPRGW